MNIEIYKQIISLYEETDDVKRGRDFEALIREIQPWDEKPPIVMSTKTEQLDGVYIYKNTVFIIESKAKKSTITGGSHDWDDYKGKISDREGHGIIGIFCSLYEVNATLIESSITLNKKGIYNFIIAGDDWKNLEKNKIDFSVVVDFMILHTRINQKSRIDVDKLKKWHSDTNNICKCFSDLTSKKSSIFLRRYKHNMHDKVYVSREIEKQFQVVIDQLKPNLLKRKESNEDLIQCIVLSDSSGTGKTTIAVDFALNKDFCFVYEASTQDIDAKLDDLLNDIKYKHNGIKELEAVNKPIIYVIDSLDEVRKEQHIQKRREIKSIFKRIEQLNKDAEQFNFTHFPILLVFTVREDYFRDWEESFEGRTEVKRISNKISQFNEPELNIALKKYFEAYNYKIINKLSDEDRKTLSIPINLEIFSEALSYEGEATITEIWEGKILSTFFDKKQELIDKHYINNLDKNSIFGILSDLAYKLVLLKNKTFSRNIFQEIIQEKHHKFISEQERILNLFVSEQIVVKYENTNDYSFKYNRFIEYLVALKIILYINESQDMDSIDLFIEKIIDSSILSTYNVLKNIRHITKSQKEYIEIGNKISEYYSTSNKYLHGILPQLRSKLKNNKQTDYDDIKTLISNTYSQDALITWDTFFILSAKVNKQEKSTILDAFSAAWECNKTNDRWKMIDKLSIIDLLIQERVIDILIDDSSSRDWEVYLGKIIEKEHRNAFLNLWKQRDCEQKVYEIFNFDKEEYKYAKRLLEIILNNAQYIKGEVIDTQKQEEYILLNRDRETKNDRNNPKVDKIITDILQYLESPSPNIQHLQQNIISCNETELSEISKVIMVIDVSELPNNKYKKPFLNYLFSNFVEYSALTSYLINYSKINFDINLKDKNGNTCFQEIVLNHAANNGSIINVLEHFFAQGYKKNTCDDKFIEDIFDYKNQNPTFLNCLIGKVYYSFCDDLEMLQSISLLEKPLYTLFSFYHNKVVGFGFTNLIQVANNALEHYPQYSEIFILAMETTGLLNKFKEKESFKKKLKDIENKNIAQENKYNKIFNIAFPYLT